MTPKEEFLALLAEIKTRRIEAFDRHGQQALFEERLALHYFAKYPRRKKPPSCSKFEKEMPEAYAAIADKLIDEIQGLQASYLDLKKGSAEKLNTLADSIEVEASSERLKFEEVWETTYSSQGSPRLYAKHKAQEISDHLEFCGVRSEVNTVEKAGRTASFVVYARCAAEDFEVLRHKTPLPLKEQIRRCWKSGANPRVYLPFLPYGYEEANGLDFYGGYLG